MGFRLNAAVPKPRNKFPEPLMNARRNEVAFRDLALATYQPSVTAPSTSSHQTSSSASVVAKAPRMDLEKGIVAWRTANLLVGWSL
jgi:hypothetical protein